MEKFFESIVENNATDYEDFVADVQQHGCSSGCVPELIYYSQTDEVFNKYEDALIEWAEASGFEDMVKDGYIKRWDSLLGLHSAPNRQLLVWAAFEDFVNQYQA